MSDEAAVFKIVLAADASAPPAPPASAPPVSARPAAAVTTAPSGTKAPQAQPIAARPTAAQPVMTAPVAAKPSATTPAAAQTIQTQPAAAPAAAAAKAAQPAAAAPAPRQPITAQPIAAQTQPTTVQPVSRRPATLQPVAAQPAAAFDPMAAAQRRLDSEQRSQMVSAAYDKLRIQTKTAKVMDFFGVGGKRGAATVAPSAGMASAGMAGAGGAAGLMAAAGPIGLVVGAAIKTVEAVGAVAQRSAAPIGAAVGAGENVGATAAGVGLDLLGEVSPALKPVIGMVEAGSKAFAAAAQASAAKIKFLGATASAVAQGDLLGAQIAQHERQQKLDEAIPIIGGIISYFRGNAEKAAALGAVRDLHGAVQAKVTTLAPYSGALAGATAQAKALKIQSDVRLASQLGPSLARATEAKSNYDTAVAQALAPFAKQMADQYAKLLESGELTAENAKKMEEALGDQTKLLELIKDDSAASKDLQKAIKDNLKHIREKGMGEPAYSAESILQELTQGASFLDPLPPQNDPVLAPGFAQQNSLKPLEF
ncbi:MAG TPA: hypothetical protein VN692_09685 [Steroidobacteraceae bacterium]|nr:hypothetical protein [Steroidobacteraceae bacterium]